MIYITGDTHGNYRRFDIFNFPEQIKMTKNDYVIILGDFGIWHESAEEEYWFNWLEQKPFTTLFIDGNHENYNRLDNFPVTEWNGGKVQYIKPSIIHLMRGQIYTIENKTFFTFGGASSHDIFNGILDPEDFLFTEKLKILEENNAYFRIKNISWWERELPNEKEFKEGLENLKKNNFKVNYILTHTPDTDLIIKLNKDNDLRKKYKKDQLTDYLKEIKEKTEYDKWYFGHIHTNINFGKEESLYKNIKKII